MVHTYQSGEFHNPDIIEMDWGFIKVEISHVSKDKAVLNRNDPGKILVIIGKYWAC